MRPGEQVIIRKYDPRGREMRDWPARVRRVGPSWIEVEATFDASAGDLHGLSFRQGDRFIETYFNDRWYNVFAVYDGNTSALKGWYCNLSRPAHWEDGEVHWVDLALDLVVLPDRSATVADEDEFAALSLSEEDRRLVRSAIEDLREQARLSAGPFAPPEVGSSALS